MRIYQSYISAIAILLFQICFSQTSHHAISAVYLGLNAYSASQADVFSFAGNQAALAQLDKTSIGVYGEKRFLLNELSNYNMAIAIPTTKGNFGLDLNYFGFENYNQSQVGLAYAISLGKKVKTGAQFNYYSYRIPLYGSDAAINFEWGIMAQLTDKLNAGVHVYNPAGGIFLKTKEKLPSIYNAGFGYDVNDNFFIAVEILKEENFPATIHSGFQYHFQKRLFIKAGITSLSAAYYSGIGIAWENLRMDFSCSYHPQLGMSPGLLLLTNFGK